MLRRANLELRVGAEDLSKSLCKLVAQVSDFALLPKQGQLFLSDANTVVDFIDVGRSTTCLRFLAT